MRYLGNDGRRTRDYDSWHSLSPYRSSPLLSSSSFSFCRSFCGARRHLLRLRLIHKILDLLKLKPADFSRGPHSNITLVWSNGFSGVPRRTDLGKIKTNKTQQTSRNKGDDVDVKIKNNSLSFAAVSVVFDCGNTRQHDWLETKQFVGELQ